MITFIVAVLLLVAAYFIYGKIVERYLDVDPSRKTPAYEMADGVDYVQWMAYESGYSDGRNAGAQDAYNEFWDTFQQNGNKTNYSYAFYQWSADLFNPKYDIDMSRGAYYTIYNTNIGEVQKTITAKGCVMYGTFASNSALRTIAKVIVSESTSYNNTFGSLPSLENITFDGVIGNAVSFSSCSKLRNASVQSIIDHLKDLTGSTAQTLTFHADVGARLTEAQKATITAKNWTLVY